MPQVAPYIPARDADLDAWSANFSTLITASPGTYGLAAGDATAIAAVVNAWHTAYLTVSSPSTKTPATIAAKNTDKILMLATLRPYAVGVSLNAGVLTSDKIALGINARTSVPTPIAEPTTQPAITIASGGALSHIIRYRDEMSSPTVKAKPYGAIACQIFVSTGTAAATATTNLGIISTATKSPLLVSFTSDDLGKIASYAARWVTRRGLVGPWSPISSYVIAG